MTEVTHDAAVLGGGLAGLCLGLQLRRANPELRVVVADARARPAPEAAFKVGESTVELSAHYFAEVLGLRDHIEQHQLPKFGLRYWFPAGDNRDLTRRLEVGPVVEVATPSYQLDRGRFENELWSRCGEAGVELLDDCRVEGVELGASGAPHVVSLNRAGEASTITARWALDTSGRFGLLKRQLGIATDVEHQVNASWFRLAGGLDLEEWGAHDEEWLERIPKRGMRRLSTNHLMGEGYWVWLIPLASGPVSIGVVADPRFHPYAEIDNLDGVFD
ncbi:MAG: NAD(P)/FAD-dependent oxidoreductase, partial [Gammaproteobacteria bacterium]